MIQMLVFVERVNTLLHHHQLSRGLDLTCPTSQPFPHVIVFPLAFSYLGRGDDTPSLDDTLRPGILPLAVEIDLGNVTWLSWRLYLAAQNGWWPSCQLLEKFLKEAEYWNKKTLSRDGNKSSFMTSFESSRWFYDAEARSVSALSRSMTLTSTLALFK